MRTERGGAIATRPSAERSAGLRRTLHDLEREDEDEGLDELPAPAWFAAARGAALFVACVILLQLVGEMRFPHSGRVAWWIDLHPLPKPAARGLLGAIAALLLIFSFHPRMNAGLRRLATVGTLGLFGAALWNSYRFYQLFKTGQLQTEVPVPFALHVAGVTAAILPALLLGPFERFNFVKDFFFSSLAIGACIAGLPIAQFFCLGKTDERGPAEAVIVSAHGMEGDVAPEPLVERIRTACALFREGQARRMVMIVPGSEPSPEAQRVLRKAATDQGIPEAQILIAPLNGTLDAPAPLPGAAKSALETLVQEKIAKVLVCGRFFELPRLKLCCQRAGLEVRSVPVRAESRGNDLRRDLCQEATTLWLCYLQPLLM